MAYIDTRDLDKELNELESLDDSLDPDGIDGGWLDVEDQERLVALRELRHEIGDEWEYGATLIPEDEFQDYAHELAEELGAIDDNAAWPYSCIDWEQAANELSQDYTSVTFDGTDYYVRL
jgi:hypothetical protein